MKFTDENGREWQKIEMDDPPYGGLSYLIKPVEKSLCEKINDCCNYHESTNLLCKTIESLEKRVEELEKRGSHVTDAYPYFSVGEK